MLQELALALLCDIHHTDANRRPRAVVGILQEGLQDPKMHVLHVGRCTQAVQRRDQDQIGINLLGLLKEDLLGEGLLHSLRKLQELPCVHISTHLGALELAVGHAASRIESPQGLQAGAAGPRSLRGA